MGRAGNARVRRRDPRHSRRLNFDDFQQQPPRTSDASPFGDRADAPAFGGETRAFPKLSFDDFQQMSAPPPSRSADPQPEPQAEAASAWDAAEPQAPAPSAWIRSPSRRPKSPRPVRNAAAAEEPADAFADRGAVQAAEACDVDDAPKRPPTSRPPKRRQLRPISRCRKTCRSQPNR